MVQNISSKGRKIINSINRKIGIEKRHGYGGICVEMEEYVNTNCCCCLRFVMEEIIPYYINKYGKTNVEYAGHIDTVIEGWGIDIVRDINGCDDGNCLYINTLKI